MRALLIVLLLALVREGARANILTEKLFGKLNSRMDQCLTPIYRQVDHSGNGKISFDECYESLLKFNAFLNRQAPIRPPTREKVRELYERADLNQNNRLNEEEFKALALTLGARAATRVLAFKTVSFVAAPILANSAVNWLSSTTALTNVRHGLQHRAKAMFPNAVYKELVSEELWKTVFTVSAIMNLAPATFSVVDYFLDQDDRRASLNPQLK